MSLPVFWTEKAEETFAIIINSLENNWGISSARKFTGITFQKIQLITTQPYLYKASISENVRQVSLSPNKHLYSMR